MMSKEEILKSLKDKFYGTFTSPVIFNDPELTSDRLTEFCNNVFTDIIQPLQEENERLNDELSGYQRMIGRIVERNGG